MRCARREVSDVVDVQTLQDHNEVQYKVTTEYSPVHDRSIRWDDPELAIPWPIQEPILSEKDRNAPLLKDSDHGF